MNSVIYVGMDVHKESVNIAAVTGYGEIVLEKRLDADVVKIKKTLQKIQQFNTKMKIQCCYEAGPTGYGLAREINKGNLARCMIVAPGNLPKESRKRIKTDRLDALKLARLLVLGDVSIVAIPDEEDEAVRELLRYRGARKEEQKRAKQQLKAFILRHGWKSTVPETWTKKYLKWIGSIDCGNQFVGQVRNGLLTTIERLGKEIADLDAQLALIAEQERYGERVEQLRLLRGVGLLTGLSLVVEVGDFQRFPTAKAFMSWVGLVPSENSSGERIRKGGITKAGNSSLRKLLTEASWHYFYGGKFKNPRIGADSSGEDAFVLYAQRADQRLTQKRYRLEVVQKKPKNRVNSAVARELAGFIWGMMSGQVA